MSTKTRHRVSPLKRLIRNHSWLVPAAIITIAALLITLLLVVDRSGTDTATPVTPENPGQEQELDTVRRDEGDPYAAGPVDAPVTLVAYSDYQCPYCAVWVADTQPAVMDYVNDGLVRIEWRDVAVFGDESFNAAVGAQAAARQDAFWAFHDALMGDGTKAPAGQLTDDGLIATAADLGLDTDQFATDLTNQEVIDATIAEDEEARDLGVSSTPRFLLNGNPIVGAQPTEVFVSAIEQELAEAGVDR